MEENRSWIIDFFNSFAESLQWSGIVGVVSFDLMPQFLLGDSSAVLSVSVSVCLSISLSVSVSLALSFLL